MAHREQEQMTKRTKRTLSNRMLDTAFELIEAADGDIEFARSVWNGAFEDAERIDHNQSLEDATEIEVAVAEAANRHDKAMEARRKFKVVKPNVAPERFALPIEQTLIEDTPTDHPGDKS